MWREALYQKLAAFSFSVVFMANARVAYAHESYGHWPESLLFVAASTFIACGTIAFSLMSLRTVRHHRWRRGRVERAAAFRQAAVQARMRAIEIGLDFHAMAEQFRVAALQIQLTKDEDRLLELLSNTDLPSPTALEAYLDQIREFDAGSPMGHRLATRLGWYITISSATVRRAQKQIDLAATKLRLSKTTRLDRNLAAILRSLEAARRDVDFMALCLDRFAAGASETPRQTPVQRPVWHPRHGHNT